MTEPWTGWEAETVERGSKALNERDQARAWVVAFESRLAEVRALHRSADLPRRDGCFYCWGCSYTWPCPTVALLDAPLEATE